MSGHGRREVLGAIGLMALAPMAALGLSAPAARARAIAIPAGRAMRLSRRLERQLADGNVLAVTREWDCRFTLAGGTAEIVGRQSDVEVDAPAALAPFVAIEKSREDTGPFPAVIDENGLLRDLQSAAQAPADDAVALAQSVFAKLPADDARRIDSRRFLAEMSAKAANAVSQVPPDLFFPQSGRHAVSRAIDLPDGTSGRIDVEIESIVCPETGLLRSTERRILTVLGQDSRRSLERWELILL